MGGHRKTYKAWQADHDRRWTSSFELLALGDAYIELLEACPCDSRSELCRAEGQQIRALECVNKRIAGRTLREWYLDNEERIKVQQKTYKRENKDKIKLYSKAYRETNKESIAIRSKAHYQANKESIAIRNKTHYQDNKGSIAVRRKAYYQANKARLSQPWTCPCGSTICIGEKTRHLKTKKHLKYLEA